MFCLCGIFGYTRRQKDFTKIVFRQNKTTDEIQGNEKFAEDRK